MYVIGTSFGAVLKFESLDDLEEVAGRLMKMHGWAEAAWKMDPSFPVKLAYIVKPDNLSDEDRAWLDEFTDGLDNASRHRS